MKVEMHKSEVGAILLKEEENGNYNLSLGKCVTVDTKNGNKFTFSIAKKEKGGAILLPMGAVRTALGLKGTQLSFDISENITIEVREGKIVDLQQH